MVYCWRIWVLRKWRVIPILTCFIALLSAASGMASGIRNFQLQNVSRLGESYQALIWLLGSAVTDIVIASSMAYIVCFLLSLVVYVKIDQVSQQPNQLLRMAKGPGAVRASTGRRIMHLLTLMLETNAITAAVAIETVVISLIKSIAPPATNIYEPGGYVLGKLYSNCFMILLNQRHHHSPDVKIGSTLESQTMPTFGAELGTMDTNPHASRDNGTM
ncbi:hypothetical protein P691DRAFT_765511 [Macrolepiota fuliginosa MF-IS2]|uniref:DUF6534 domain-containing protein n=1 Tax=Macrolepiota fuliginosa MF-IS2 TaxID=1400762 RepID=A0A9P5WZT2_9AGAR|nr:hypothetical protein P691DRAFT_765511 [Macrolepiota fuliginosa MF-IS2]